MSWFLLTQDPRHLPPWLIFRSHKFPGNMLLCTFSQIKVNE